MTTCTAPPFFCPFFAPDDEAPLPPSASIGPWFSHIRAQSRLTVQEYLENTLLSCPFLFVVRIFPCRSNKAFQSSSKRNIKSLHSPKHLKPQILPQLELQGRDRESGVKAFSMQASGCQDVCRH